MRAEVQIIPTRDLALVLTTALLFILGGSTVGAQETCSGSAAKPICSITSGIIAIQVEAEAEIEAIGGYESARDEALLNSLALIAETVTGLDCKYGKCRGISEVVSPCPAPSVEDETSISYSTDLQSVTWQVRCEDKNKVRVGANYRREICHVINRLGTYCLGEK